jgi:hypothetical protein
LAAPSRRASPSNGNPAYKEDDLHAEANPYEVERDRRKKALHDRVQLALIQSGFEDAARLREAFSGEGIRRSSTVPKSTPRRRRDTSAVPELPRRSARNLPKDGAVPSSTPTSLTQEKEVRSVYNSSMYLNFSRKVLGCPWICLRGSPLKRSYV